MTGSPDLPDPRDEDALDLTNNYEGLLRLHEVVPAAEELDLADEVAVERERARLDLEFFNQVPAEVADGYVDYRSITADADLEATTPAVEESAEATTGHADEASLSDGQVQGLVEHLLQATPIPDGDDASDDSDGSDDG